MKAFASMRMGNRRAGMWLLSGMVAASAIAVASWLRQPSAQAHKGLVYSAEGWGGYVPVSHAEVVRSDDPLQSLREDYRAGRYAQVETEAVPLVEQARRSADPKQMRAGTRAELLSAYAAARQGHFTTAEERFAQTRTLAADLPDHGAAPFHFGEPEPSLEEEAAFQQIVCVGAEGKPQQAEAGYRYFLQRYPQSILIHAAVKRIARSHGGDVPKDAEKLWTHALQLQAQVQQAQRRAHSLCGPECLAELLKRQGKPVEVERLAQQMHTDETGTSLAELAQAAQRHGYHPQGLLLTPRGLQRQKLPLVALVESGHFVLVDQIQPDRVQVWDPDANGVGHASVREFSPAQWQQSWSGYALALTPPPLSQSSRYAGGRGER